MFKRQLKLAKKGGSMLTPKLVIPLAELAEDDAMMAAFERYYDHLAMRDYQRSALSTATAKAD